MLDENGAVDPIVYDLWHVISAIDDLIPGKVEQTRLLGETLHFVLDETGDAQVWSGSADSAAKAQKVQAQIKYGYIWAVLGTPSRDIFDIPEFAEPGRRNMNALSVGVHTSAPRVVENFLDMAHFPFVHTDILGEEPHTEVVEYNVSYRPEDWEILANDCKFYQPKASAASNEGVVADYAYRVPHPFCAVLYKSSPDDAVRLDAIAVFAQPLDEEHVRAHLMLSVIDHHTELDKHIRLFQQTILGQDKPILENQMPRKLPLDPRAETPIRADKVSIAYRRWLRDLDLQYGVLPATAQ
ncbi:MAG: aromatic ring-hydroxylating dioxygenase subunit alpha [Pseudomonadota bacterium]